MNGDDVPQADVAHEIPYYPEKATQLAGMRNRLAPQPTIKEQLEHKITVLENEVKRAKRALELLDKNPDFAELHDLLNKAIY